MTAKRNDSHFSGIVTATFSGQMTMFVSDSKNGVILRIQVQPRASRDEVVGPHGDALKIRVTAPPVAGAANKHLLKFLANKLQVAKSRMSITSGATSRAKSIAIEGISAKEVRQRLTKQGFKI